MGVEWANWSGSVRCTPKRIELPADEAALGDVVRAAANDGLSVRVAGTGHSFTPLVATDGVLVSLDRWTGVEAHDTEGRRATVRAGMTLRALGEELFALGLAMENLGDVDVQTVGGAVGTGTHGTGPRLANISAQVIGVRLVTADGGLLECAATGDMDLLRAARVSLGALGVTSAVTLRLLPAYCLEERVWRLPHEACMADLLERIEGNARFEFFWFPASDEAECKTLNPTELPPDADGDDLVLGTPAATAPGAPREPVERRRVGWSARVIPSIRERRFNEMEYAVPAAAGPDCFRAVRRRMRSHHTDVLWPVEYRTLAADDAYLSPAYGRESVTISIHQDARLPHAPFFDDIEPIFLEHGGRPHWGKVHGLRGARLADRYPMWDAFHAQREKLDPAGRFLNGHLRGLFGIGTPGDSAD